MKAKTWSKHCEENKKNKKKTNASPINFLKCSNDLCQGGTTIMDLNSFSVSFKPKISQLITYLNLLC